MQQADLRDSAAFIMSLNLSFQVQLIAFVLIFLKNPDKRRPEEGIGAKHDDEGAKSKRSYSYRNGGGVLLLLRTTRDELLCGKSLGGGPLLSSGPCSCGSWRGFNLFKHWQLPLYHTCLHPSN